MGVFINVNNYLKAIGALEIEGGETKWTMNLLKEQRF